MQTNGPIYLDYNATTPIDPAVLQAMLPYLRRGFGNPSSSYSYGHEAKEAVERARGEVAALLGANADEIVFTSGGSESDNQAIIGAALANMARGKHIITAVTEHPAVINTCKYLEAKLGFRVTYLSVDGYGMVDPVAVRRAITRETVLVTLMHANNEVGAIAPIAEIGAIARERGILFHTDAAQSAGKIDVDVTKLNVDLLTVAGHKLYAPKGIGALYIRRGVSIDPLIHGASQESGRRAGTENVPYMAGLGKACELARQALPEFGPRVRALRDRLYAKLAEGLGEERLHVNGHPTKRLPNTLNVIVRGLVGEELLRTVPEIAASTGAACHSGSTEPSGVLLAMGLPRELALGALRLSLGRWSAEAEVDEAARLIVERARKMLGAATPSTG